MKAVYPFVTDNRNLASYTNTLTQASYWDKVGITLTSDQTDPTGGTNATRIVGTGAASIYALISLTTGATYTLSCYVKSTGGSNQTFRIYANGGLPFSPNLTATSTWQLVTLTFTAIAGTNSFGITRDSSTNNFDILAYGIQMELGSTATDYQPIATTTQAYIANHLKFNLVNPFDSDADFRLVFNGGWTHSSNGATPNGTNGYADTKLNPISSLSSGSKHLSFYSRTQNTLGNRHDIGCEDSVLNKNLDLFLYFQVLSKKGFIDGNYPTNSAEINNTNTLGYQIGSRTSSSNQKLYFNNSLIATNTTPLAVTDPNFSLYIGATNTNNTATSYSIRQTAFATIGDGLLDAEASALYNHVQNFQLALNRAV